MFSTYGELATEVYDLDKPLGHAFGDVAYYRERLRACRGRILEPAVGSGRVLIPLLEAGLVVEGLDDAPAMLASCRQRCEERGFAPDLHLGTMQTLALPQRYEAIILPAGSFLLLESREEALQALSRFHEHLMPGGRLILDLYLETDFALGLVSTRTWLTPAGEVITLETKRVEVDFLNQRSVSYLRYEKWREGRLLQTELQRLPLAWYGLAEFRTMLESSGFADVEVSADYAYGQPPSHAGQTFTFEARRV